MSKSGPLSSCELSEIPRCSADASKTGRRFPGLLGFSTGWWGMYQILLGIPRAISSAVSLRAWWWWMYSSSAIFSWQWICCPGVEYRPFNTANQLHIDCRWNAWCSRGYLTRVFLQPQSVTWHRILCQRCHGGRSLLLPYVVSGSETVIRLQLMLSALFFPVTGATTHQPNEVRITRGEPEHSGSRRVSNTSRRSRWSFTLCVVNSILRKCGQRRSTLFHVTGLFFRCIAATVWARRTWKLLDLSTDWTSKSTHLVIAGGSSAWYVDAQLFNYFKITNNCSTVKLDDVESISDSDRPWFDLGLSNNTSNVHLPVHRVPIRLYPSTRLLFTRYLTPLFYYLE